MKHRLIEFETPEEAIEFLKKAEGDVTAQAGDIERGTTSRVVYSGRKWRTIKKACAGATVTETGSMAEAFTFLSRNRLQDLQAESEAHPYPPKEREKAIDAWQKSQESWMAAREAVKACETEMVRLREEKKRLERAVHSRRLYCYETSASLVRALGSVPVEVEGQLHYPSVRGRRVFFIPGTGPAVGGPAVEVIDGASDE